VRRIHWNRGRRTGARWVYCLGASAREAVTTQATPGTGDERAAPALLPGAADRVLVLAPHPDDETLAAGGLLQRAVSAGARVRVVLVTDGENNPWAQRASERRLRIGAADRARFGACRRAESLAALECLGVPRECVHFLAFTDQGLTSLLVSEPARACDALAPHLLEWRPTLVAAPTAADLHPDHSALAVLTRLTLGRRTSDGGQREVAYLVHNPALRLAAAPAATLVLEHGERDCKRAAILCHASQMHLRGPWLRSFGGGREKFLDAPWPAGAPHPVASVRQHGDDLLLAIRTHPRLRSFGARTLLLLTEGAAGDTVAVAIGVPAFPGRTAVRAPTTGAIIAWARFSGGPARGTVRLPAASIPPWRRAFVKLERRFGFFDEAGWIEVSRPASPGDGRLAIGKRR
jgi:LmbE family N-acetylglucosaminyl deacetylase